MPDEDESTLDAAARAIADLAGGPEGVIEEFAYDGAGIVAERHGDPAARRTFVLLHGIGMGRKVFADLVRRLRDDACVVALDLPGYGEAPEPPRTPTIPRIADLVAAYLRHLDRGPVVLLGHSMGTQVAVEVATRHPETVHRLVLVAPTVDRRRRRAATQLARLGRDLLGESPKVLLLGTREYLRAGPHLRHKLRAMLAHRPEDAYPRIAVPTLLVRGELDLVVPQPWFDEVAAAVPDAVSFVVEGHHHETLIRTSEPTVAELRRWLAQA
ncbi:alpha/beta fold hydrolase [Microbacterium sp.]|uniref:alpha/beta fold hydrolase n=1 Tax=Microbacterium sp. TaxID=51671 RepID=UPI0039E34586